MRCREFVEFLDRYVDGDLSSAEQIIFDEHIRVCLDCANYLHTYKATIQTAKAAFSDQIGQAPAEVPEGLVAAILSALCRTQAK